MKKIQRCRICLAENVHMYVVVNKTLHDLYKKLTNNPFVTEDSRPILACYICCAQLKKCYRFQKKCLEAEEQFTKMMNEEYERKPLINQDQFELFHGFIRTPIDIISIVDVDQTENIVVKEEVPAVCERRDDVIEVKEGHESDDDLKPVNRYDNYLDIEFIPTSHFEAETEDDVPLMKVKTEIKEQKKVPERNLIAKKGKSKIKTRKQPSEKRKRGSSWSESDLQKALDDVKHNRMSERGAALKYNIPRRTLNNHIRSGSDVKRLGRKKIFTDAQEKELLEIIKQKSSITPLTPKRIRRQAYLFCERNNIKNHFSDKTPNSGKRWVNYFLARNKEILQ